MCVCVCVCGAPPLIKVLEGKRKEERKGLGKEGS